ncbi:UNVERIFIED_CONTAM: hypothetical protein FKN15_042089 [Acipenser sinensis]
MGQILPPGQLPLPCREGGGTTTGGQLGGLPQHSRGPEPVPCLRRVGPPCGQLPHPQGGEGGEGAPVPSITGRLHVALTSTARGRLPAARLVNYPCPVEKEEGQRLEDSWEAYLSTLEVQNLCPACAEWGHLVVSCPTLKEEKEEREHQFPASQGDYMWLSPPPQEGDYLQLSPPPPEGDYLQLSSPPPKGVYLQLAPPP